MMNKTLPLSLAMMSAFPVWAANNEVIPAGEAAAILQIAQMIADGVRNEAKNGKAHRGAHAKGHGCVKAEFVSSPNYPMKSGSAFLRMPAPSLRGSATLTVREKYKPMRKAMHAAWQ